MRKCLVAALWLVNVYGQSAGLMPRDLYFESDQTEAQVSRNRSSGGKTTTPAAARLALRYNLLQVDPTTKQAVEVDPGFNFRTDDCFAVRITPNQSGYLYVFNIASSGAWQALLPSPLAPDVSKTVTAGQTISIPNGYCFNVEEPPGSETLLIVMTRTEQDLYWLDEAIRNGSRPAPANARIAENNSIAALIRDIKATPPGISTAMVNRELSIQKIGRPLTSDEPPHSTYVVQNSNTSGDRIIISVRIRHE